MLGAFFVAPTKRIGWGQTGAQSTASRTCQPLCGLGGCKVNSATSGSINYNIILFNFTKPKNE